MVKTKSAPEPAPDALKQADLLALVRTSADENLAQVKLELCKAQMQSLEFQAKLALSELQAAAQRAETELAAAKKLGKQLADDVASRYAFDWATTTYDDITGHIRRVD